MNGRNEKCDNAAQRNEFRHDHNRNAAARNFSHKAKAELSERTLALGFHAARAAAALELHQRKQLHELVVVTLDLLLVQLCDDFVNRLAEEKLVGNDADNEIQAQCGHIEKNVVRKSEHQHDERQANGENYSEWYSLDLGRKNEKN